MTRTVAPVLLAPWLLLAACGGSDIEDFESRRAAASCAFEDRCGHPLAHAFNEDFQGPCETWSAYGEEYDALLFDAERRGTLTFRPEAEDCVKAMEDTSGACADAAVCGHFEYYEGQVEEGGACRIDEECVAGTHCETDACPGTCTADFNPGAACAIHSECLSKTCSRGLCAWPPAPLGASCTTDSECDSGLCDGYDPLTGAPGACAERAEVGEACEWDAECKAYLVCSQGRCIDRSEGFSLAVGEPCARIEGPFCEHGLVCAFEDIQSGQGVCRRPVGSGEACSPAFPDPCPEREYCDVEAGRCRSRPGHGEACGAGGVTMVRYLSSQAWTCAADHFCVGGVCRRQGRAGDTCELPGDCWWETCEAGTCEALACDPDWY